MENRTVTIIFQKCSPTNRKKFDDPSQIMPHYITCSKHFSHVSRLK